MKMRMILPVIVFLTFLIPTGLAANDAEIYHLLHVQSPSFEQVRTIQSFGIEIEFYDAEMDRVEFVARECDLLPLATAGIEFDIEISDMASFFEKRLAEGGPGSRDIPYGSMGGYLTNSEVLQLLDDWAIQYPNLITQRMSIGSTIEGRDIWAVKISDNPNQDENEPECAFDSLLHAREPAGMMTLIYFMQELLENYGTDPELTYLVDNREIWFIPVQNPDGYLYNQQTNPNGGGMWRKNRRNNGGSYGVDLNRNYGFKWGYDNYGSSPYPSDETYRGTSAFSEPETQASRDFTMAHPIVTNWNTHTYGNYYLCPFGYDYVYPYGNDWTIFQEYLDDISANNGYAAGAASYLLYQANGIAIDWHYAERNIFSLTPEIGSSFWPSQSSILPLAEENYPSIKYWTWVAGSYVFLNEFTLADDNGDGLYFPGEPVSLTLTLRNKGLSDSLTDAIATVSSSSAHVNIVNGTHNFGTLAAYSEANNNSNPLIVEVSSTVPYGEAITLDLEITFDGAVLTEQLSFTAGAPQIWFQDNFETNQGWTVQSQNITSGEWERAVPNYTSGGQVAPLNDNPAGTGTYCYVTENGPAGGQYSSYDVDGGPTILTSPVMDLSGSDATVSLYAWYYSRDHNDAFEIDISNNNGSTWTNVLSTTANLNDWEKISFNVSSYVTPSSQVKVRVSAQDQPNNDIVEAGLDDFQVLTYESPVDLSLSATPYIGTTVNVIVDSPADGGLEYYLAAAEATYPAFQTAQGLYVPLKWDWLANMSTTPGNGVFINFYGYLDGSGYSAAPAIVIPNNPGLIGMEIFVVGATLNPTGDRVRHVSAPLQVVIQ